MRIASALTLLLAILLGSALVWAHSEAAVAPTVTGVSPALGSRGGGTTITITGTGFLAGASVTVGGNAAAGVAVNSSTSITATTPAGTPGTAVIRVTNTDGQSGTLSGAFSYQEWPPSVTGVAPGAGTSIGGTTVVITGTNFAAGARAVFGGTNATSTTFDNSTQVTAVTPAHSAGTVDVQVVNLDGQLGSLAGSYTYAAAAAPTVTSTSPASGTTGGGTPVTITGTNFANGATVTFGGTSATPVQFINSTQLIATTPAKSAGAVAVMVTNPDTQSGVLVSGYTYAAAVAPTVTGVSPVEGALAGGTTVTVTGTGFLAGATVKFGATAASSVTVTSATQLTATSPATTTAGAVAIEVKNTDNQLATLAAAFTYLDKPSITGVTPTSGPSAGGTTVTISGSNFGTSPTATFGGKTATSVMVKSPTSLEVVTPAGTGVVDVSVRSSASLEGTKTAAFTYTGAPTLTSASPLEGPTAGGTKVTILGSGFTSGASVFFDGVAGASVSVAADGTSVTATTPAHTAGPATIEVKLTGGQSASLATPFTYVEGAGTILSGKVAAGTIGLVVFGGGTSEQLIAAATANGGCPSKDRLIVFALVEGNWLPFIPAAPAAVNAAWKQRFAAGLPARIPLFIRCT